MIPLVLSSRIKHQGAFWKSAHRAGRQRPTRTRSSLPRTSTLSQPQKRSAEDKGMEINSVCSGFEARPKQETSKDMSTNRHRTKLPHNRLKEHEFMHQYAFLLASLDLSELISWQVFRRKQMCVKRSLNSKETLICWETFNSTKQPRRLIKEVEVYRVIGHSVTSLIFHQWSDLKQLKVFCI